jgi:alkyl sulfatase BDS1-like metallo-beta-lactamase superfamily hydrolase
VWNTLKSLATLRALDAEILITGHGEAIHGRERIRADIDRMIGAISHVRDYTIDGMNAGRTVHELMADVSLPEHLTIGEYHGRLAWAVKSIWEAYSGWFHYEDGTTELYATPRSAVNADLVELAGGAGVLAQRAQAHVEAGRPLQALHLLDIALGVAKGHSESLIVKLAALEALLAQSGSVNLSLTMWLRSEIAQTQELLSASMAPGET